MKDKGGDNNLNSHTNLVVKLKKFLCLFSDLLTSHSRWAVVFFFFNQS